MHVSTIDSVQNQKYDLILADTVRADRGVNGITFLKNKPCLNVEISRVKIAIVVFGDFSILKNPKIAEKGRQYSAPLRLLIDGYKKRRHARKVDARDDLLIALEAERCIEPLS